MQAKLDYVSIDQLVNYIGKKVCGSRWACLDGSHLFKSKTSAPIALAVLHVLAVLLRDACLLQLTVLGLSVGQESTLFAFCDRRRPGWFSEASRLF